MIIIKKSDLLFYDAYEDFYNMAETSDIFGRYCKAVFGEDFSQDGFSDVTQINDILSIVSLNEKQAILDIGCGNGKMLQYIHTKTKADAYGFDYSENAIAYANKVINDNSGSFHFDAGIIGEIEYQPNKFDVITSIDTIYFAKDMIEFTKQIIKWLKPNGYFVCGYQEGDVKSKSKDKDSSDLALALKSLGIEYDVFDYTKRCYDLLLHKRKVVENMKAEFINNGLEQWYEVAISQSIDNNISYNDYSSTNSRYIYIVRK
ncbi:MAG: class I SAM-dependent methyltransferase [Oscillospiraceae bacterium]